ncbi:hypothetical protein BU17DRAFT_38586 [Hysterangium stoloniferum]|nr:hypothetical protein BU17DRAFT_38586 [Hysterangium stoloniferum]
MVRASRSVTFSSSSHFLDPEAPGIAQSIEERINPHSRPVVSYYFPNGVGEYHYGELHPMKPHRLTLTNALVLGYGLDKHIHSFFTPRPATKAELELYHDSDYVDFLSRVSPSKENELRTLVEQFNCVEDCPVFAEMYDFCRKYAGASLAGARRLSHGNTDIAINWSGGLHHAKRGEASGFCYVNDIVLAILELLRYHPRVLYIDIDIHHGDGVELAFWQSNRVMTVSFHKYNGDFFPGTGKLNDNGNGIGKHFCLNIPLEDGIDDDSYVTLFKTIIEDTVTSFRPTSIVLQCGADSLGCDRLGAFNLSIAAHGECVSFVKRFNLPLLILGGGGYTIHNVSRCWAYETSVLVGAEVSDDLPSTPYDSFFAPDYRLHPKIVTKVDNLNTPASLQKITASIKNKLRYLEGAPSVQMQEIPPDLAGWLEEEERNADEKDEERGTGTAGETRSDPHRAQNEFFDSDGDLDRTDDEPSPPTKRGGVRGRLRSTQIRTRATLRPSIIPRDEDDFKDDASTSTFGGADVPITQPVKRGKPRGRPRGSRAKGRRRVAVAERDTPSEMDLNEP